MKAVVLKSRIPEIEALLPIKLDEVAEVAAELIADDAKDKVPVETGDLEEAIHVQKIKKGTWAVVAGDKDAFYGHLVENGTTHSPPEPFLIPAFEEGKPEVYALAAAALRTI